MNNQLPFANAGDLFDALVEDYKARRVLMFALPYGGKDNDSLNQLAKSQKAEIKARSAILFSKPDTEDTHGRRSLATLCQFDYFDLIPKNWLTLEQLNYRNGNRTTALEWIIGAGQRKEFSLCGSDAKRQLALIPDLQNFHELPLSRKIAWRSALEPYAITADTFNLVATPWENLQPIHSWGQL